MRKKLVWACWNLVGLAGLTAGTAAADMSFSWDGFVRSETAFKASDQEDPYNQRGNVFNGVTVVRKSLVATDSVRRDGLPADNVLNMQLFRGELESTLRFDSNLSLQAKLRAVVDPGWYDNFNPRQVNSQVESTVAGNPYNLYGRPNFFKYVADGQTRPQPMEWSGRNYLVYFPALFLDYSRGPMDLRLGMQQIAWGQALFFRVLDVPDGLDARRHSFLDYAAEEFSDKRVPAPALRLTYQLTDDWLADAFLQKFQPSVLSNPNTPYNFIASQFTVHDHYPGNRGDYGIRLKGAVGDFGLQAIAVHRYNPDGVFRWTASHVDRGIPGVPGSGLVFQNTAFEIDPTGVQSAQEWFHYAGAARLNGVTGLNAAVEGFPAAASLGAFPVDSANCAAVGAPSAQADDPLSSAAYQCAAEELNTFFQATGGLRGHIERDYFQEDVFGGGASYVVTAAPGSLLDQLIINLEATYVPDRTFTSPDLGQGFVHKHEWTSALVLEKYQRFSEHFLATYMVLQWMHKSESDLYGRYLGGMGGDDSHVAPGYGGGWNAIAFAVQQPFANATWRADLSTLYDPKGGLLVQPALRWKPSGQWTVETFYNYLNGSLSSPNKNIISTAEWAKEVTIRVGYQF